MSQCDEEFSRFLSMTGHRVFRTASGRWHDANRWFLLGFPSHVLMNPPEEELRELFASCRCLGVRFPTPLDAVGKMSYQIVCDARDYGVGSLSANTRSKVRRGLRRCEVRPVSFALLAEQGLLADRDTLARQGRPARLQGESWGRYWKAAAEAPGMEGWAAFASGELAAFLVTVQFDDCVEFMLARSRRELLSAYPNNALIFSVLEEMLVRRGVREVTFGLESLEPVGPLDEFKFSMGFRPRPLRQRVVFRPSVGVVLRRRVVRRALYKLAQKNGPGAMLWRKAAGLLRFAAEGGF